MNNIRLGCGCKMATINYPLGFQCEFMDFVPEDFYCKSCNLVARKFTITSCCGETYCHACIADTQEQGKLCLACGEKGFDLMKQMKYQKKIEKLQVYCSMKKRGCDWSGPLEQLDTHLDPDQDNCQYVDTKCPLNCHVAIPKNKVEQHVALHCVKRPYVCQYCNFKATYEEVVDKHLLECKYVPLQCPNFCGVTFERDFIEDHMKMCRLEKIRCKFRGVGCNDQFSREDQEKHSKDSTQNHLMLTANVVTETKQELQDQVKKYRQIEQNLKQKFEDQKQSFTEQLEKCEQNLKQKLEDQKQSFTEQLEKREQNLKQELEVQKQSFTQKHEEQQQNLKQNLKDQEQKLKEQNQKMKEQEQKISEQEKKLTQLDLILKQLSSNTTKLSTLSPRIFTMENFYKKKENDSEWCSPDMYTHIGGYKFHIRVKANGDWGGHSKAIAVYLLSSPGEFDDQLKWPAKGKFTLELINQRGKDNAQHEITATLYKPAKETYMYVQIFDRINSFASHFIEHSKLSDYLDDDKLHFHVSKVLIFN